MSKIKRFFQALGVVGGVIIFLVAGILLWWLLLGLVALAIISFIVMVIWEHTMNGDSQKEGEGSAGPPPNKDEGQDSST